MQKKNSELNRPLFVLKASDKQISEPNGPLIVLRVFDTRYTIHQNCRYYLQNNTLITIPSHTLIFAPYSRFIYQHDKCIKPKTNPSQNENTQALEMHIHLFAIFAHGLYHLSKPRCQSTLRLPQSALTTVLFADT